MNIEIAEPGRMTQTGSSLLKLIQNNDMPLLDLLVRESIQNSLDAYRSDSEFVKVEFIEGVFEPRLFHNQLEAVKDKLNEQYSETAKYLAICDSNTVGLTGPLHFDDVTSNDYGNLLKLIYEISKPQQNSGAGGSWGLGKTVYFRIGIGMVLYYSRIRKSSSEFQSRLAVSLIEDESKEESIIPPYSGKAKRGIAWWGEKIGENKTRPIIDEKQINSILNIFGLKPYDEDKTGTVIIIPYIDEKKLLTTNLVEHKDSFGQEFKPHWYSSVSEYLNIAVQKWYAPRLNNRLYPHGKFLKVVINNNDLTTEKMEPFFQMVQSLYNRAVTRNEDLDDFLKDKNAGNKIIKILNYLDTTDSGAVAYAKVTREELLQCPPFNKYNPYVYLNCEQIDTETNKAIIMYTRKPGMVVSYETTGAWTDSIAPTNKNEYIIGFFVLNSNNKFKNTEPDISLEEYIRKGELADHTSWSDMSIKNLNPRVVSKIQTHVRNQISKIYKEEVEEPTNKFNSGLGKFFGDALLPPVNFGKNPSIPPDKGGGNGTGISISRKGVKMSINNNTVEYYGNYLRVPFSIKTTAKNKSVNVEVGIVLESKIIDLNEWEKSLRTNPPFKIDNIKIEFDTVNKIKENTTVILNRYLNKSRNDKFTVSFLKTDENNSYGFQILSKDSISFSAQGHFTLEVFEKDIKTTINVTAKEED